MNKFLLLALVAAVFVAVRADEPSSGDLHPDNATMTDFRAWMKQWLPHTKMLPKKWQSIKITEIEERYKNWKQTVKFVYEHNLKTDETWQAGTNMFSHLTDDEFKNINWGLGPLTENITQNIPEEDHVDILAKRAGGKEWKGTNKVKAVRNQGSCGSCWAFSAAAALEGGLLMDINPQQVLDCSGAGSCNGGDPTGAVQNQGNKGVSNIGQYNGGGYQPAQHGCAGSGNRKCTGKPSTSGSSRDSDLDALLNRGPVSVCINADGLKNYKSGIANAPCTNSINHAVLATGYTSTYFNVKNSWGTSFGEQGYFRFPHGNNKCGISSRCVMPNGCN